MEKKRGHSLHDRSQGNTELTLEIAAANPTAYIDRTTASTHARR